MLAYSEITMDKIIKPVDISPQAAAAALPPDEEPADEIPSSPEPSRKMLTRAPETGGPTPAPIPTMVGDDLRVGVVLTPPGYQSGLAPVAALAQIEAGNNVTIEVVTPLVQPGGPGNAQGRITVGGRF